MEKSLPIGAKREFLNEDYFTSVHSMIGYSVKLTSWTPELVEKDLFENAIINFSFSSCSRTAELDFGIDTKEEMRNSLHKLDTIINVCQSMKEDLKKARVILREGLLAKEEVLKTKDNKYRKIL